LIHLDAKSLMCALLSRIAMVKLQKLVAQTLHSMETSMATILMDNFQSLSLLTSSLIPSMATQ